MIENKKILVLSMSAWNSKVGSDTWPTLLSGTNPDNIANIALREETPDSLSCNNYFVLSENRVLKSIINRRIKTGKRVQRGEFSEKQSRDLAEHNLRYKKMSKKRGFFGLFAREVVWKLGKWKSEELNAFLEDFKPDIILYFMDGYIHFNRLCRYAKKKTGAKSIGFFVDDNFTYKQPKKAGLFAFRILQRLSLKKLAKETDGFWAITDMTKKEADKTFGINCSVVTKPLNKQPVFKPWQINNPIQVLYTGNLQIGRDKSLLKFVNAVKELNKEQNYFKIDVYTKTQLSDAMLQKLNTGFCRIHSAVPQSEIFKIQESADILLFLEDVDGPDSKTARLSFSTKITDYLSSGKSIFAVGCTDTAPMQYFIKNDIAIVAETEREIAEKLRLIENNASLLADYAMRACECGIKNHNKESILKTVHNSIESLLEV